MYRRGYVTVKVPKRRGAHLTAVVDAGGVLSEEQLTELRAVVNSRDVPAVVGTRARIVLWMAEGRRPKDTAE